MKKKRTILISETADKKLLGEQKRRKRLAKVGEKNIKVSQVVEDLVMKAL